MPDIPSFTGDVDVIAALSDLPNATDGLTAAQLKAKFDEAANLLKTYLNSITPLLVATTQANLTYYVRKDGSDSNTGLANTAGGALLTIAAAFAKLPRIIDHTVTINVAIGTYAENLIVSGFSGRGIINLVGTSAILTTLNLRYCPVRIAISGFDASGTAVPYAIISCGNTTITSCTSSSIGTNGFVVSYSKVLISSCTISNKTIESMKASTNGEIVSSSNSGADNLRGLVALSGIIRKSGTQPAGATAEFESDGGQIV